jgi:hypothetical protein
VYFFIMLSFEKERIKERLTRRRAMIRVVNYRDRFETGVYVGRPSVLGNPFAISSKLSRAECLQRYQIWLRFHWKQGGRVKDELLRLAQLYKARGELTLVCWCKPLPCHADVIKDAVEQLVKKGLV